MHCLLPCSTIQQQQVVPTAAADEDAVVPAAVVSYQTGNKDRPLSSGSDEDAQLGIERSAASSSSSATGGSSTSGEDDESDGPDIPDDTFANDDDDDDAADEEDGGDAFPRAHPATDAPPVWEPRTFPELVLSWHPSELCSNMQADLDQHVGT